MQHFHRARIESCIDISAQFKSLTQKFKQLHSNVLMSFAGWQRVFKFKITNVFKYHALRSYLYVWATYFYLTKKHARIIDVVHGIKISSRNQFVTLEKPSSSFVDANIFFAKANRSVIFDIPHFDAEIFCPSKAASSAWNSHTVDDGLSVKSNHPPCLRL